MRICISFVGGLFLLSQVLIELVFLERLEVLFLLSLKCLLQRFKEDAIDLMICIIKYSKLVLWSVQNEHILIDQRDIACVHAIDHLLELGIGQFGQHAGFVLKVLNHDP
jgi:hypothetical protein